MESVYVCIKQHYQCLGWQLRDWLALYPTVLQCSILLLCYGASHSCSV